MIRKPLEEAALDILARSIPAPLASEDHAKRAAAASMACRLATLILARPGPHPDLEQWVENSANQSRPTDTKEGAAS
jgi:hypothetical protein